jgi:uncharacterized protein
MKFTQENRRDVRLITSHAPGEIRLGPVTAHAPLLVSASALVLDWSARDAGSLDAAAIESILALRPEVVLIGTPLPIVWPPASVRAQLLAQRIGCEVMEVGAACRTFNVMVQEDRAVVAALFP